MAGLQSLPAPSTFECSEGWAADTTALEIQEEESLFCYPKGHSWGNWKHWWDVMETRLYHMHQPLIIVLGIFAF